MNVRIISITKSLDVLSLSAEELITYVARVSNPDNQMNHETALQMNNKRAWREKR